MKTAPQISPVMQGLSAYIASALRRPLPPAVLEKTKHHLLDTLAAMLSGSRLPPGKKAISFAKTLGGTKEASVVGSRIVTAAANAALANGMLGHADETDDSHSPSQTHPGCGVVAAAFAMAERERASGTALLRGAAGLRHLLLDARRRAYREGLRLRRHARAQRRASGGDGRARLHRRRGRFFGRAQFLRRLRALARPR